MQAAEGKLFKPLAYPKTIALFASVILALTILPPFAHVFYTGRIQKKWVKTFVYTALIGIGIIAVFTLRWWLGLIIAFWGVWYFLEPHVPKQWTGKIPRAVNWMIIFVLTLILASTWAPLGVE